MNTVHAAFVFNTVEARADPASGRLEPDPEAMSEPMGPATQDDMVLAASARLNDEVLFIQYGVSSDTWLMDAIARLACAFISSLCRLLRGPGTS